MRIEFNTHTPNDAIKASDFGVEIFGLIRTEYMFFDPKRFATMMKIILEKNNYS